MSDSMTRGAPARGKRQSRSEGSAASGVAAQRRIRLPKEERELSIIQGAISFFAEVGLSGDTRQLARRLNITHPLLFKYFGSKEGLLERVYHEVYMRHWNPFWEDMIKDRGVPLQMRMRAFYNDYARAILSYEWIRIFLFSGLRDADFHRRFLDVLRSKIFVPLCAEIRHELGLPGFDEIPVTDGELDLVWGSHSTIFYYGVRKWVYQVPQLLDIQELIDLDLDAFFGGTPKVVRGIVAAAQLDARKRREKRDAQSRTGTKIRKSAGGRNPAS
jgi:AcrR family transcriptional regulator